jgi:hypothetical protein
LPWAGARADRGAARSGAASPSHEPEE